VEQIADLTGAAAVAQPRVTFEELHSPDPRFFRASSDAENIAGLERTCPDWFELMNGDVVRRLGHPERLHDVGLDALREQVARLASHS
jgi:hypothetical protein